MIHVRAMAEALEFYEVLGGRLVFGSRDGDWALLAFTPDGLLVKVLELDRDVIEVDIQLTTLPKPRK